jgi:hypothetical protein
MLMLMSAAERMKRKRARDKELKEALRRQRDNP